MPNPYALRADEIKDLLPFCENDTQRKKLELVIETGTHAKAAEVMGINASAVSRTILAIQRKAARMGHAPSQDMTRIAAPGFQVKGTSTLYNNEGEISAQWVKTTQDREALQEELRATIDAFREEVPKSEIVAPVAAQRVSELLNVHILTDYHLGMKSWHEETGEDWDIRIAEDLLVKWFEIAIRNAPDASRGVLGQIGDFLHWDGLEAVTPTNRHVLDADTRFQKVVRVAIRSLRRIIGLMLEKYDHVHLIMADANHDPASSAWLREMFSAFYSEEPRITVDNSADTYYGLEHGLTSVFFHHGHKRKPADIDDVFVSKFREIFGRTKFSYCHMGHLHHQHLIETKLMVVEQHRTMAAKDAYASRGGWMSGRGAPVITYHKDYGEVGRQIVTPEMTENV